MEYITAKSAWLFHCCEETGPLCPSLPGAISAPDWDSPFLNLSSQGAAPALTSLGASHTSLSMFCIEEAPKPDTLSGHGLMSAEYKGLIQFLDAWMDHVWCLLAYERLMMPQGTRNSHRVSPQLSHPQLLPFQGFSFRGPRVCIDLPWISQDCCWLTPPAWLGPEVESCVVVAPEMIFANLVHALESLQHISEGSSRARWLFEVKLASSAWEASQAISHRSSVAVLFDLYCYFVNGTF